MATESASIPTDAPAALFSEPVLTRAFKPELVLVWILFLLSGSCGLIYEVLWCRHLGLMFGNTSHSLSAVLTAFMGGLALGSFISGRLCHKIRRPLLVYGVLEVLIGVYCALLPLVFTNPALIGFYRSLYGEAGSGSLPIARFVISFVLLLIPTTFMGATLPLLTHFLVRSRSGLGRTVGALYAINSLGAVLGALAAGFFLLPVIGKSGSNWLAVAFNLILGALAIGFGFRASVPVDDINAKPPPESRDSAGRSLHVSPLALRLTMLTFGITGFAAMATQIGWTRAISLGTGSSTYAFSLIVGVFILGLSSGGWWGSRVAPRTPDPLALLAKLLMLVGLFSFIVSVVLGYGPLLFFFLTAWASPLGFNVLLMAQALGIALLIIAPTFLMGATMPLTIQVASQSSNNAGKTVGTVYAINTVGSILGSFFGGLFLIPALQIQSTLEIMALLYAVPGVVLFLLSPSARDKRQLAVCGAILLPLAAIAASGQRWDEYLMSGGMYLLRDANTLKAAREFRIRDAIPNLKLNSDMCYYKEGSEATVAILRIGDDLSLRVGGKPDASSRGDMATQISLTLFPEVLHPKGAEDVLVIGLGSGVSVGSALAPETVKRVDVVEMSPEVVIGSWWFQPYNELTYNVPPPTKGMHPAAPPWIQTPKVEVIVNDGRNHLLLTSRMYDVIASEPSNPWMAGVGNLFTEEAFTLCRSRLKPGGLMCQWLHSYSLEQTHFFSIVRTFTDVYKHAQLWQVNHYDYLLVGSETPIDIPIDRLRQRLAQPQIKSWLERVHLETDTRFMACLVANETVLKGRSRNFALHTDDNMLLEFEAPRAIYDLQEGFQSTPFLPMPERSVDMSALSVEEKATFIAGLDRSLSALEQSRYAIEHMGPLEQLAQAAYTFDPRYAWAIEKKNKADYELARQILSGSLTKKEKPDPEKASRLMLEAKGRSKFVIPPHPPLNASLKQNVLRLIDEGKLDEASSEIKKIDDPTDAGGIMLLHSRVLHARKENERALAAIIQAGKAGASPLECSELAARILVQSGRTGDAIATLRQTLNAPQARSDRAALPLWTLISNLHFQEKQFPEALDAARMAGPLDTNANRVEHMLLQAKALMAMDKFAEAYPRLRLRVALSPLDPTVRLDYARVLLLGATDPRAKGPMAIDLLGRARRAIHEQVLLQPESPVGWELLARIFLALQKCDTSDPPLARQQTQAALKRLLELHKGDESKVPDDLKGEIQR